MNLKRLATEIALPVASPTSNGGAASGTIPAVYASKTKLITMPDTVFLTTAPLHTK